MAVDRVAEAAFTPVCPRPGFRLRQLALVELPSRTAGADLADRDQVQGAVEPTISGPGEPVAPLLAAGGLDRRRAAVAGEVVVRGEPLDRAGMPEDLRRQDRPDAGDLGHARAVRGHRGGDVLGVALQRSA